MPQQYPLETLRHSLAHVMAAAVKNLYGDKVQFGIGPVIENGFYYDFDFSKSGGITLSSDDFKKIEEEMKKIISQNLNFIRSELPIRQAVKKFKELGQNFKLELLNDIKEKGTTKAGEENSAGDSDEAISVYETGNFLDLCRGPHAKNTKELTPNFKIMSVAGAYWRGDEKNPMLTRLYAVAFETKEDLEKHLHMLEEAEKRDHRKLGKALDLFSFHDEGPGFAFWHYHGLIIREELISFWRKEHKKAGYVEISTPIMLNESLWHTSGHMKNYKENMYFSEIDEMKFAIKPMNCPGGLLVYKEKPHSYRELPLRVGELGLVHRHEMAGALHGLFRVRNFTQDDAHIYCTQEQIIDELKGVIALTKIIYNAFGFEYKLELSTRPEKYCGQIETWNRAEDTLKQVLKELNLKYEINEGDGAFYGPKIDFHIQDSIGRTWQCGTLQLDFAQPENFELEYIDKESRPLRPVMLHRTIYGSLERFIGILIEHFAGAFPLWLSPVQIGIIPVSDKHLDYAEKLEQELLAESLRAEVDSATESVGKKIRNAEKMKIPYMLVVGDKEMASENLVVRKRGEKDTFEISHKDFIDRLKTEIEEKA